jgi:hypothetical protein
MRYLDTRFCGGERREQGLMWPARTSREFPRCSPRVGVILALFQRDQRFCSHAAGACLCLQGQTVTPCGKGIPPERATRPRQKRGKVFSGFFVLIRKSCPTALVVAAGEAHGGGRLYTVPVLAPGQRPFPSFLPPFRVPAESAEKGASYGQNVRELPEISPHSGENGQKSGKFGGFSPNFCYNT